MIVFIVYFIIFITLVFLLAKLHINDEFNWKINLSIAAIGAIFLGLVTISQANYPAEYSQPKTETHNLVEYGTNRYFLMSTTTDTTTVLIEDKDGSYHPESFDNDIVSYKRTGDTPQITITYKTVKKRPMWKKVLFGGKDQKVGKKMITSVKIEFPKVQ
mgnify:CR=1 FL=1